MAMAAEQPFYHRKLDRSPENADFHTLQPQDKQLISQIRSAMDGTREKMTRLRDDIEDKERDISRETALRRAAEARLDQLVDMYGDPAVNEELRQRLPRAGKSDVRVQWQKELEEGEKTIKGLDSVDGSGSKSSRGKKKHTTEGATSGSRRRRRGRGGSGGSDVDSDSEEEEERGHRVHSSYPAGAYPPGYQPMYGGYPSPPYPGYMPPMYHSFPPQPMMYPSPVQGADVAQATPVQGLMQPVAMQPHMQAVAMQPVMMSPTSIPQAATGAVAGQGVNQASPGDAGGLGATSLSKSTPDLNVHAASLREASASREQNRQISLLLAELDAAKDLNKKLQGQLSDTQQELDSMKITMQTKDAATEVEIAGKAAALVEEIYRAQQQRDKAMMGRLRLANEARDEALLKLRTSETSGEGYEADTEDQPRDTKLRDLLSDLDLNNSSNQDLSQRTRDILNTITATQQRKNQLANEEMRAVMQDRDSAVAKCKQMEADMLRLQRQTRVQTPEKQQHATLQAKLLATQQERDLALAKVRKLEEEMQTLRVYYSLHKSLSQEANLRDQFNNTLHSFEGELHQRDHFVDATQKENNHLVAQLQAAAADRSQVMIDLEKAQQGRKEAQSDCEK